MQYFFLLVEASHLDSVDGRLELVDLLLQRLFDLPDVFHVVENLQLLFEAGVVDDDVRLLLVDDLARLAVGHLRENRQLVGSFKSSFGLKWIEK